MTWNLCAILLSGTLTEGPLSRKSNTLCRLKNRRIIHIVTCRPSSCNLEFTMYTVCVLLGDLDIIEDSLVGHNIKILPVVVAVPLKKIIISLVPKNQNLDFLCYLFPNHLWSHVPSPPVRHQSVCSSKHFGLGGFNFVTTFAFSVKVHYKPLAHSP